MSLYYRYRRWRGDDTTTEIETRRRRYRYVVEHTTGEKTEGEANDHVHDEAFLILKVIPKVEYNKYMGKYGTLHPPWRKKRWDSAISLESIVSYGRYPVGEDVWTATVDKADRSLVGEIEHEFVKAEEDE